MGGLFDLYPRAKTFAVAGLYWIPKDVLPYSLSKYICIVPRCPELDAVYLTRIGKYEAEPTCYMIGVADDSRYWTTSRNFSNSEDAESSMTLAHLAMCIFHRRPYKIGPTYGFTSEGGGALCLAIPGTSGSHWELENESLRPPVSELWGIHLPRACFDVELQDFFKKVARAYVNQPDKRWLLAAIKYESGMSRKYAHEAILDLAVSMEALLNQGEQIGVTLRLNMALLVGKTYTERIIIKKDIKDFYRLRSDFVHGRLVKIGQEELALVKRIGEYLGLALIETCCKNIKNEVFPELEYMNMLGAPRYSRERVHYIITAKEIIEFLRKDKSLGNINSYEVYLSEPDEDGDRELLVEFQSNDGKIGPINLSVYLFHSNHLKGLNSYSYGIFRNEDGQYEFHVTAIK